MNKNMLIVFALVLFAFATGYALSQKNNSGNKATNSSDTGQSPSENTNRKSGLRETISYSLPDGWIEQTCTGSNAVFLVPNGTMANCDSIPVAPVKVSIDTGNHTDCNQLQNQSQVKKHTCISEFINDRKTLKSSTEYLSSSSYNKETVVDAYYFDSGKGVVLLEYIHSSNDSRYQMDFERFAKSLQSI